MKNIALELREPLTAENVHRRFKYNKETGELFRIMIGGKLKKTGYHNVKSGSVFVGYNHKQIKITHIIWLIAYGKYPHLWIDHRDGDPTNNKLDNLREATPSQNSANSHAYITNKSGAKGVSWSKYKWRAQIRKNGVAIHIGVYNSIEEAKEAYNLKAVELFGEFVRS
jgi:hypothetical protein